MNSRLNIEGLAAAQLRLTAAGERARQPEPALRSRATLEALRGSEKRRFRNNRFRKNTAAWDREKRRKGLSPKRMQASGLLRLILEAGSPGSALRFTAYNAVLTWGLHGGRTVVYYARILADRDRRRRAVYADKHAKIDIGDIVTQYVVEDRLS